MPGRLSRYRGLELPRVEAIVEEAALRRFAAAVGGTDPGHGGRETTAPPTYLFCLEMQASQRPFAFVEEIGLRITDILHASQSFVYHRAVHIGDRLTFAGRVADIFDRKEGKLVFVVQDVRVSDRDGLAVADLQRTLVVRPEALPA